LQITPSKGRKLGDIEYGGGMSIAGKTSQQDG